MSIDMIYDLVLKAMVTQGFSILRNPQEPQFAGQAQASSYVV